FAAEGVDVRAGEGGGGGRGGRGGAEGDAIQSDRHVGRGRAVDRNLHGRVVVGRGTGSGVVCGPGDGVVVHTGGTRAGPGEGSEAELVGFVASRHDVEGLSRGAREPELIRYHGE